MLSCDGHGEIGKNTQVVIKNCPDFTGRNKESFHVFKSELCACLFLHSKDVFEVVQGKAQPLSTLGITDTATVNAVAGHKWLQANQDFWSHLLLTTSGSAMNAVKTFVGKRPDGGSGHGKLAWKTLTVKFNGHTKNAKGT